MPLRSVSWLKRQLLHIIFTLAEIFKFMDTRRQLRIASVIKDAFSEILVRDGKNIYGTAFVTVTNVKVTSDLTLVRFYLSIYNVTDKEEVIGKFNFKKFDIKKLLAEKLRHQLRRIPELEFFVDDTQDYVTRINEVFNKIKEEDENLKAELEKPAPKKTAVKRKAPAKKKAS
jgi:ribosome-binding factor A